MTETLHAFLSRDHERLDALLSRALLPDGSVDLEAYGEFRAGLLRHIGIEERILFTELRRGRAESPLARQLHRDHAALAALLVPPPTPGGIDQIRAVLSAHNPLEEARGGLYDIVDTLPAADVELIAARARDYPPVPVAPYTDSELLRATTERLLREADEGRAALRAELKIEN